MSRITAKSLFIVSTFALVVLSGSHANIAQDWPSRDADFQRGPGFYLAWWKMLLCIPVFFFWVKAGDWVNVDLFRTGENTRLKFDTWNPALTFSFLGGFVVLLCVPIFWIGYPIYLLSGILPYCLYLGQRNKLVPSSERTLLPLQKRKSSDVAAFVLKQDQGVQVDFVPGGDNPQRCQANLIAVRQNPFFLEIKEFVNDVLLKRAERVQLEYSKQAVAVGYEIDGVWLKMPARDRESGDAILEVFKTLADLDPKDRKSRQEGSFQAVRLPKKVKIGLTSVGIPTGERVTLKIAAVAKKKAVNILKLGMLQEMLDRVLPLLKNPGYVLVSSMPGDGMSSSWLSILDASDLVTRDFAGVCDKNHQDNDIENIEFREIDKSAGETPLKELKSLALKLPQAFVVPDPCNGETVNYMCDQIEAEDIFCVSQTHAKSAVEAILRLLVLQPDRSKFAKYLTGVIFHRLFRRLCDRCKQGFKPTAKMLKQLGLPVDPKTTFFQQYQPPPPEELVDNRGRPIDPPPPCSSCGGTGYYGRIAVFELLEINDKIRQAIVNKPTLDDVAAAARMTGHRNVQSEAVNLLINGITSVQEIQRVLKK